MSLPSDQQNYLPHSLHKQSMPYHKGYSFIVQYSQCWVKDDSSFSRLVEALCACLAVARCGLKSGKAKWSLRVDAWTNFSQRQVKLYELISVRKVSAVALPNSSCHLRVGTRTHALSIRTMPRPHTRANCKMICQISITFGEWNQKTRIVTDCNPIESDPKERFNQEDYKIFGEKITIV